LLRQIEQNIFAFRHRCLQCGSCCTHMTWGVPIYHQDAMRIARNIRHDLQEFLSKYCKAIVHNIYAEGKRVKIPIIYLKTIRGGCVFLHDATCSIHSVKPYLCRSAPCTSLWFHDRKTVESFRKHCPGFGKGAYYSKDEIRRALKEEMKLENKERELFAKGVYAALLNPKDRGGNHGSTYT
jgi:Fe-S-cluster containining protein